MHSGEDMEQLGKDIANDLLKIASPKTICICLIGVNTVIAFGLYYLLG